MEVIYYVKKFGYLLLGVLLTTLLLSVPLFAADKQGKVFRQPGQGIKQWLTNLEKVLDSLNLTAEQKDLALKIAKERADAFVKFATAQAQLGRLARDIRNGQQVSDDEAKRALETYYKEQNKYLATLKRTEKDLRTLPPKAQVVILAHGLAGGRAGGGRIGGRWQRQT
jgi:gas vesicle protein